MEDSRSILKVNTIIIDIRFYNSFNYNGSLIPLEKERAEPSAESG